MTSLLDIIELLGTLAFAYGGIVEARRNNLDLVGAFTAAFLSAFGGGTLRDVLLDRRPLYWVAHPSYPLLVFVLTVVVQVAFRGRLPGLGGTWWLITDALGLGLFSAAGVSIAVEQGLPLFPASLFGVITATFGGVLRDVICAQVPGIFKRGQLYATCAFAGAWVFILLQAVLPGAAPVFACITVAAGLRLAAVRFDLTLPA